MLSKQFVYGRSKAVLSILLLISSTYSFCMDERGASEDFDSFKREYVDHYFPAANDGCDALVESAPLELRHWFDDVARGEKTQPALLYGAYGVGKTMTSQALTKRAGCTLCYLGVPEKMCDDWPLYRFDAQYLRQMPQKMCVVVDNIDRVQAEDLENLNALLSVCGARDNLHLLIIAYYARSKMPHSLYSQFRKIKFPTPNAQERFALLKHFLRGKEFSDDVDEGFLRDFSRSLSEGTARDIHSICGLVLDKGYLDDEESGEGFRLTAISRSHFEQGLEQFNKSSEELGCVFLECE